MLVVEAAPASVSVAMQRRSHSSPDSGFLAPVGTGTAISVLDAEVEPEAAIAVFWLGAEKCMLEEPAVRPCARMRATAASATIMTMAWVLPVGRSGWILASTMYYLVSIESEAQGRGGRTKLSVP